MGKITFVSADDCLNGDQKNAIKAWYNKDSTDPPWMPDIPKRNVTGYAAKKQEEVRRTALAGSDFIRQAMKVFEYGEYDRVLKMRENCDFRIANRVNFHWRRAMNNWMTYGLNQWKASEGIRSSKRK